MAMHIGMSDLSVFRFARHSWYGIATASGMYVGHFMAWISASILYALQLHRDPTNVHVLPGPLAYQAAGVSGLLCVVIAGWTTANPTIYRAGLAFQAILIRRFGLSDRFAERTGISLNWAAGLTRFLTLGICWYLQSFHRLEVYFLRLPGWFIAVLLYLGLSAWYQRAVAPVGVGTVT